MVVVWYLVVRALASSAVTFTPLFTGAKEATTVSVHLLSVFLAPAYTKRFKQRIKGASRLVAFFPHAFAVQLSARSISHTTNLYCCRFFSRSLRTTINVYYCCCCCCSYRVSQSVCAPQSQHNKPTREKERKQL